LTIVIPRTISVRLDATYAASVSAGNACLRTVGLGVKVPYFLSLPLRVVEGGGIYRSNVPVDNYRTGRCEWHFAGIHYFMSGAWPQVDTLVAYQDRPARFNERLNNRVDVWCIKDKHAPDSKFPQRCMGWWMLNQGKWVKPDFEKSVPAEAREQNAPLIVTSDEQSAEIRFHDVDSMKAN
jgi:hypothetical protein